MANKYAKKILHFINKVFPTKANTKINFRDDTNKFIEQMRQNFIDSKQIPLDLTKTILMKKIHSQNKQSLIYIILEHLYREKILQKYIDCNNFENILRDATKFADWYGRNQTEINIKKMLSESRSKQSLFYYGLLFESNRREFHNLLYDNRFISYDIIHYAESIDISYEIYEGNDINLHLYTCENSYKLDINMISRIVSFMRVLFNKPNLHVKIIGFLGKHKKYLPDVTNVPKIITPANVNSGASIEGTIVMIWREEEFYKVLIHELIHYFGIDFCQNDTVYEEIEKIFRDNFKIHGIDKVNESYTEALAIFINSIIFSVINSKTFDEVIKTEIIFSRFQVAKILNYFGITKFNDIGKINQSTSITSYYVVKYLFLENLESLTDYWRTYGFEINKQSKDSYANYVKLYSSVAKFRENPEINDNIDNAIGVLKFLHDMQHKSNDFIYKTMRMSVNSL